MYLEFSKHITDLSYLESQFMQSLVLGLGLEAHSLDLKKLVWNPCQDNNWTTVSDECPGAMRSVR